jgi:hypothetical protein
VITAKLEWCKVRVKIFSAAVFICAALFTTAALADGARVSLPAISGWDCGDLRETEFDSVSGAHGYWQVRCYNIGPGVRVKATLMAGGGPKFIGNYRVGVDSGDGPWGSGCKYKTFPLAAAGDGGTLPAILETHPLIGSSLTVKAEGWTLTVEAGPYEADEADLRGAAARLSFEMLPR